MLNYFPKIQILTNQVAFCLISLWEPKWIRVMPLLFSWWPRKSLLPLILQNTWSWLYSSIGSRELYSWTLTHISWSFQCEFERILFSILLKVSFVVAWKCRGGPVSYVNCLLSILSFIKSMRNWKWQDCVTP